MAKKVFEVIELLEANGWVYQRTKGDHRKYKKEGRKRTVIVSGARNSTMPVGTLAAILRETGLDFK